MINWKSDVEEHDYPAAHSYLSLAFHPSDSDKIINALKSAPVEHYHAKDILRSSKLPLLGKDNHHVKKDLAKITGHKPISPILLVRDPANGRTIIADGYHRLCAAYHHNEDEMIPAKIV